MVDKPRQLEAKNYPSISDPTQDVASLQATVRQLKEAVELLTGQRGGAQYSVVEGLAEVRKVSGQAVARFSTYVQVTAVQNKAEVTRTEMLEAAVGGTKAAVTDYAQAVATDANYTLAKRVQDLSVAFGNNYASVRDYAVAVLGGTQTALASRVTTLNTTVGDHSATLTLHGTSIGGIEARYSIVGTIDGVSGSFIFEGVKKLDGTGATFTATFNSNVVINGNLLVTGSVNTTQIAPNAITTPKVADNQITSNASTTGVVGSSEGQAISVTLTCKGGRVVLMFGVSPDTGLATSYNASIATQHERGFMARQNINGAGFADVAGIKAFDSMVGWAVDTSTSRNVYSFQFAGTAAFRTAELTVPAGTHTFQLYTQGNVLYFPMLGSITALELAK